MLGHRVLDLAAGKAPEFDTRTPDVIANQDGHPSEVRALLGPQGERVHVRTGT